MTLSDYGRNCSEVSIYRGHSYFGSLSANNEQSLSFRQDYMLLACGQCLPCSALSQFPNEMTHELILLNKGCPKCFSPHGQAQFPGSPNLPSPALTPRVLHLLVEGPTCDLHCTKSCAQGAQFPLCPHNTSLR